MQSEPRRLALLIDIDQEDPGLFGSVFDKVAEYGTVVVRRAYGGNDKLAYWEQCLCHHDITPVTSYANGRNAADATLIIDAMDLLHSETVDGFCIVASDHIYTNLVRWLQDHNVFVAGIGRLQAAESFKESLGGLFTTIEDLSSPTGRVYSEGERVLVDKIKSIIGGPKKYVLMSILGEHLIDTDYHAYCHGDLMPLIRSYPDDFVICDGISIGESPGIYVGMAARS